MNKKFTVLIINVIDMASYPVKIARKAAWMLHLTGEKELAFSEPIPATGRVVSKKYEDARTMDSSLFLTGLVDEKERMTSGPSYIVEVEGPNIRFEEDDENLFLSLGEGDPVSITYRHVIETVRDYVPGNFESKKVVRSRIVGARLMKNGINRL